MELALNGTTAGAYALDLLNALNSGSRARVDEAIGGATKVLRMPNADARDEEFRDLLDAVIESVSQPRAVGPVQRAVAVQMLRHVAGHAA